MIYDFIYGKHPYYPFVKIKYKYIFLSSLQALTNYDCGSKQILCNFLNNQKLVIYLQSESKIGFNFLKSDSIYLNFIKKSIAYILLLV